MIFGKFCRRSDRCHRPIFRAMQFVLYVVLEKGRKKRAHAAGRVAFTAKKKRRNLCQMSICAPLWLGDVAPFLFFFGFSGLCLDLSRGHHLSSSLRFLSSPSPSLRLRVGTIRSLHLAITTFRIGTMGLRNCRVIFR